MKRTIQLVACVAVLVATAGQVHAAHLTNIGAVDAIDNVFLPGGGVFNGSLSSGADESWMVFNATFGDMVNVNFVQSGGDHIGAIFFDSGDGVIQVGDAMNIVNWNPSNTGLGSPLQVISGTSTYVSGGLGSSFPNHLGSTPLVHQFVAGFTGQYGIVVAANNQDSATAGQQFQITLSGNTGSTAVPEPSTFVLLTIGGIALIGYGWRRKRQQAA